MQPGGLLAAPPASIEALTARERDQLEAALKHRFMAGNHNMHPTTADGAVADLPSVPAQAQEAMQAWLMVQSARLRHIDPQAVERAIPHIKRLHFFGMPREGHRVRYDSDALPQEARASLRNAHAFSARPEYAVALNNMLALLESDRPLHPVLRSQVMAAFNQHRLEERISPPVEAMLRDRGLEALAEQGYRLNSYTGELVSRADRRGTTPAHQPAPMPAPTTELAAVSPPPETVQPPPPALNLTPAQELWLNQTLGLSSEPRPRKGKLPDSAQYQRIKSMPAHDRANLEATLEYMFMAPAGTKPPATVRKALDTWLTAQQVRLRVHSEASLKHHAKVLHSVGNAAKMVMKATVGTSRGQSEFSRFHSEHESAMRPEYAIAINNFLRVMHPSSPLSPEQREHVAARLMYHAHTEGTLSAPVLEELEYHGPLRLAAQEWRLDPVSNEFSPPLRPTVPATDHAGNLIALAVHSPHRRPPRTPSRP